MYAVIEIPVMSLQAIYRLRKQRPKGPIAILDESGRQSAVCEVNRKAAEAGVALGMQPAQALARCPEVTLLARSPDLEEPVKRLLILLGYRLGPRVEATAFGVATIDLRGVREDTVEGSVHDIIETFKGLRMHARIGVADTASHARWAALFAKPYKRVRMLDRFLKHVPITAIVEERDLQEIFEGWGIRDAHAFWQLPREEVGDRLGARGLRLWDQIAGRDEQILKLAHLKPQFRRKQAFEYRIESLSALLFILKRFVDELALELEVAQVAAYVLEVRLQLDDKSSASQRIEVPEPSGRAETLFRILETGLERFSTKAAIVGVELRFEVMAAQQKQGDFFAVGLEDAAGFAETADRIAAIVGPQRSGSPRIREGWRPDAFFLTRLNEVAAHDELATKKDGAESETTGLTEAPDPRLGLPISRFRPPRPVRVRCEHRQPVALESGEFSGAIAGVKGPWVASGNWWEPAPWARVEWDVELKNGGLLKIYQQRNHWYLEGVYG